MPMALHSSRRGSPQLQGDANIDDSLIGVIVRAGVVTLTGEAGHYGAKWAAEEAAKRVPEVRAIANEIHVKLHERGEPSDTDIAQASVADTLSDVLAGLGPDSVRGARRHRRTERPCVLR